MYQNLPIAVALSLLACVVAALAMGLATGKAVDAVARQPEASGKNQRHPAPWSGNYRVLRNLWVRHSFNHALFTQR